MGIDTVIKLPANVTLRSVSEVLGRLLGCAAIKRSFDRSTGFEHFAWYVQIDAVETESIPNLPECARIYVKLPNGETKSFLYHFESEGGARQLRPTSTSENIALGKALVDFFGGTVLYEDSKSGPPDYVVPPKDDAHNCPEDGAPWQNLQQRIFDLKPLKLPRRVK